MHSEKMSPLHPNALEAMSIEPENFDEASNALMELERRDKQRAAAVSLRILEGDTGDVFYRAFAFEVLYCAALDDAVSYIEAHAATAEVYVLGRCDRRFERQCRSENDTAGSDAVEKGFESPITTRHCIDLGKDQPFRRGILVSIHVDQRTQGEE